MIIACSCGSVYHIQYVLHQYVNELSAKHPLIKKQHLLCLSHIHSRLSILCLQIPRNITAPRHQHWHVQTIAYWWFIRCMIMGRNLFDIHCVCLYISMLFLGLFSIVVFNVSLNIELWYLRCQADIKTLLICCQWNHISSNKILSMYNYFVKDGVVWDNVVTWWLRIWDTLLGISIVPETNMPTCFYPFHTLTLKQFWKL